MFPWSKTNLLRKALNVYAGDHVLKKVLSDGEASLQPNARGIELTILFLDVLGFDAQTEGLNAVELCESMTNYYNMVAKSVAHSGGELDTFVGRSASAWWGVNGELDHALRACECARTLLGKAKDLNIKLKAVGHHEVRFKIGINTCYVALGNFGSSDRLRFTVMGDEVTLARSLCECAISQYAFPILLSKNTNAQLIGNLKTELVDTVRVKGMEALMEIYGIASGPGI